MSRYHDPQLQVGGNYSICSISDPTWQFINYIIWPPNAFLIRISNHFNIDWRPNGFSTRLVEKYFTRQRWHGKVHHWQPKILQQLYIATLSPYLWWLILGYISCVFSLQWNTSVSPFRPEFTIVIFIHYKPWIADAILDLQGMKMTGSGWKNWKKLPCIGKPVSWKFSF